MIYSKIASLLASILDIYEEDITEDMELTPACAVEKIHLAKLIIECEKLFGITIHDENVHCFRTIKDIERYIESALATHSGNTAESSEEERLLWYYL